MAQIKESEEIEFGENYRYKSFSMRLDDRTIEMLKKRQKKSGKSWNRFVYHLLISQDY